MARKRVWLTWLPVAADTGEIRGVIGLLSKSGLDVDGTPWNRDVNKVGWLETAEVLVEPDRADVWLIAGRAEDFQDPGVRYGLSLTRAMLQAKREAPIRILFAGLDAAPAPDGLPALLQGTDSIGPPAAAWGAKTVAAAMRAAAPLPAEPFRVSIIAHSSLGQWFEVGPADSAWNGALFGVDDGEITHHGVGPGAVLPEQCTLEYPSMGLRIDAGGHAFTCCSVKNRLEPGQSYFVRVTGMPASILFGEHPEHDEAEVRLLDLL